MPDMQVQDIQKSVGETLTEIREQKNLTKQEVANQLHLDIKIIEALETENFDVLPSPAYARGYLRNYAKLLSMDADRIIAQYNNKAPQPPELIPDVKHPSQVSSSDKPVKAVTYLVTFMLVLLVLAWVQSNFVVRESVEPHSAEPEVTFPENVEPSVPETGFTGEAETSEPVEAAAVSAGPGQMEAGTPVTVGESGAEAGVEEIQTGGEAVSNEGETQQPEQSNEQATAPLSLDVDENQTERNVDVTTGPDSISMKLTANSWIEIYDAFDNRLLMTLARSGEEISLKGTAPFKVKLGFSQGVILYFNGEYFDPAPYSHGGVANFTLGE